VQGAVANVTQASTINLRGLGTESTLVLLDGRRIAPGGSQGQFYDVSVFPSNAIERIEVVADGASAIYGSEAVGGVVNFITKRDYQGAETRLRYGSGDGFDERKLAQNFGMTWDSGDVFVAYEHFERSGLLGSEREVITQDLRPWGGPDLRDNFGSPGTIVVGGVTYAIPQGQDGRSLSASQLVPGTRNQIDINEGRTYLADQERDSLALNLRQSLTENLEIWYGGYYNRREYEGQGLSANSGAATATLSVPRSNPFFVHPTNPAATSVSVNYGFLNDFRAISTGGEEGFHNAVGLTWDVAGDWTVDVYGSYSGNKAERRIDGQVRTVNLAAALADSNPATAFNPFCDGFVFECNNPATLARLSGFSYIGSEITTKDAVAKGSGSLFDLPGGSVRAALGVQYTDTRMLFANGRNTTTVEDNPDIPWHGVPRDVKAVFAEVLVPIVGSENSIAGVRRLELSLAGRYEDYSDFGDTSNPKFGLNWAPFDDFMVRASYGTSFRAPTLFDIDPIGSTGPGATSFTDPRTGQQIRGINLQGPRPGLQPESATTISAGFDWTPSFAPGLRASVTWYDVDYVDRLSGLATTTLLANEALFPQYVIRDPSAELVLQLMASPYYTSPAEPPQNIRIIVDSRRGNIGGLRQRGIDASLSYAWDTGIGNWSAGVDANYLLTADQSAAPGFSYVDVLDVINNPVTPRARARLAWNQGDWRADAFVNYVGGYKNDLVPPAQDVDSWVTLDLSVAWSPTFGGDAVWGEGWRFALSATNALDEEPPVVINTLVGNQGAYDSSNASAIGRVVGLEVTKSW
jgi:iron complex outermembrane receptor protein